MFSVPRPAPPPGAPPAPAPAADWKRFANAEQRSLALLREWLSPEQLVSYETNKTFEVIGSKTGKRYRIQLGTQQNVYELNRKGRPVFGWCFMPTGLLPVGDVMLAQKIALETDEEASMKVAMSFWTEVRLGGLLSWIDDLRWALPSF